MKKLIIFILFSIQFLADTTAQFYNSDPLFTIQNGAILIVEGDFSNNLPGHFKNYGTVIIKGNITNHEVMAGPNTGNWKLEGTTLQNINGVSQLWVKHLEINNLFGVLLNNIVKVDGLLDFTKGIVGTSNIAYPLILSNLATIGLATPVGDLNHVSGYIVKEGLGTFTYPVGDDTKYQPVQTNLSISNLGMLVKYLPNDAVAGTFTNLGTDPTPLTGYNNTEYWSVAPYLGGIATGTVSILWDGYNDANPTGVANRKVAHKIGLNWQNEGKMAIGNTSVGSVTSNMVNTWSPFTLGFTTAAPLPLKLLEFTAKNTDNGNLLNWKTANEINVSHFDIERSEDAKRFEKIGLKTGNVSENYEFLDNSSLNTQHSSLLFYRLKMNDLDGQFSYSKIVSIMNEPAKNNNLMVFPNPVSTVLNIENSEDINIEIINMLGQTKIFNVLKTNGLYSSYDVTGLTTGLYTIKGKNGIAKFLKE